ncbi:transmembrane protein 271 [Ambystoma mexicanum]|uniref:transmembrane protein 271 n=1 Tax=Ambystoma mexicanum TaxID=8296 RepID=UPI0037E7F147
MKCSSRGACAALSSCLLLACALSAAAVGLKCFSLGSELRGEPFRLGAAAGAFYSGLLLLAGLALLGSALLCCREQPPGRGSGRPPEEPGEDDGKPEGGSQNFLLLGVLVFMLGVLSAFAGAVIDGDTVSLVERKYSHHCVQRAAGTRVPEGGIGGAQCQKLKDYQRGLVISTIFNSLECLLGLLNLLLVKNYKAAQQRRRDRRARRRGRHSRGSLFSVEEDEEDYRPPRAGPDPRPFQSVSYINVGVFHVCDEAGVEVHCGGHPSVELPGYSPMDPELNPSYPYCYPLPHEMPPPYDEIYPRGLRRVGSDE